MNINTDSTSLVKLLKKKGRASAAELGTNKEIMDALAKHGVVETDGHIKTGNPGRPPVAWKLCDEQPDTLPDVTPQPKRAPRNGEGLSQAALDSIITDVLENHHMGRYCECLKTGMSTKDIRALNEGCISRASGHGRWVCQALDAVRRRAAGAR